MLKSATTYVIIDMGIAHVLTKDRKCIELAFAHELLGTGELHEFHLIEDAYELVKSLRQEGSYWQIFDVGTVPWDKPPIDDSEPLHDWLEVKKLIQQILELSASSKEKAMRDDARSMGISYEEYLAAAITQAISELIEG